MLDAIGNESNSRLKPAEGTHFALVWVLLATPERRRPNTRIAVTDGAAQIDAQEAAAAEDGAGWSANSLRFPLWSRISTFWRTVDRQRNCSPSFGTRHHFPSWPSLPARFGKRLPLQRLFPTRITSVKGDKSGRCRSKCAASEGGLEQLGGSNACILPSTIASDWALIVSELNRYRSQYDGLTELQPTHALGDRKLRRLTMRRTRGAP
jgi:hypothetical protein